jgi:uncharacterized tellurite resistance protein B-like protein
MRPPEPARIAPVDISTHIFVMPSMRAADRLPPITVETSMLDGLRQFIAEVVSSAAQPDRAFDDTGYRLAATALLIHVISIDGEPSELEKRKLHSLLETSFRLDPGTADQLIASATLVEGEAVDLYHFTSVIMRSVNAEGRLRIVEMMWELVYADGHVSEFEDNVVWRAADLLGVSSRDRIDLKHRVASALPAAVKGDSDIADAAR